MAGSSGRMAAVWTFSVLFAGYGVVLLASLFSTNGTLDRLLRPSLTTGVVLVAFTLTLLVLGYRGMRSHLSPGRASERLVPVDYLLAPAALLAYFGTYLLLGRQPVARVGSLVAFVQAASLGLVLGVFSRPLVPPGLPEGRRDRALEHHLYNWWRSAQVAASFMVAFGVGLAAASYLQLTQQSAAYTLGDLALLSIVTGLSGVALGLYTLAKLYAVGRDFQQELADGSPERPDDE